jgi:3-oxoacyl-[acyl-carrier protein] reductase
MILKNKKAIVTGGSRGIGKAIVLELASKGCDVVFTFKNSIDAAASIYSEAEKTVNLTLEKLGGLDILVNNAGITKDNLLVRMSEEDFDNVISANLKSVFNYSKAAAKFMIGQRFGRIINITSVVAIVGNPGQANYVASKSGVIGLTKSNAKELSSRNITVNAVAPGYIASDMTVKLNDKQKESIISSIPLKRIGSPEDVAKVVSFLASSDAGYITGQVISVDGGMAM